MLNDKDFLLEVAKGLREAERDGLSRCIRMTDTLANLIAQRLDEIAERMCPQDEDEEATHEKVDESVFESLD